MRLPLLLRGVVLLLLAAALLLPRTGSGGAGGAAPWLEDAAALERAADSLLLGTPPPALLRAGATAPTAPELALLAAAARRAPLFAALPPEAAPLVVDPPARALAGRAAAVGFRVRAPAGDSVTVRLRDESDGVVDSARVVADGAGRAEGAFRVRPTREGWREWTVEAGGARVRTGVRVDSAGAPRVLVRAGLPHWEAKFVVRALEESGAVVETAYDLGRGMSVVAGGGAVTAERLERADAVVVLHGAPLAAGERTLLAAWAAERGGGVLLAGSAGGPQAFALSGEAPRPRAVDGPALRWSLPPELSPLPADPVRTAALLSAAPPPGAVVAAETGEGAGALVLRPLGRGRAAALALTETWRWRMEAGRVAEHREFWRALVDWLASPPRAGAVVSVPEPVAPAGGRHELRVFAAAGAPSAPLLLRRPGGGVDTLPLAPEPGRPGVFRAGFVSADTGVHLLAFDGEAAAAGLRATAGEPAPAADGWARLGVLAHASGGGMVTPDSLRTLRLALAPAEGGRTLPAAWLLFGVLLAAAAGEWAIRRLRGAP